MSQLMRVSSLDLNPKVTILSSDDLADALTVKTFTNEAQLISPKECTCMYFIINNLVVTQISSLSSSTNAKPTFIEETPRLGLEPCPQPYTIIPNVQFPPAPSLDL